MTLILDLIEDKRVFWTEMNEDKTEFLIREGCDDFYEVILNKTQLTQLIDELSEIRDQMPE